MTGHALTRAHQDIPLLDLWKICHKDPQIISERIASYYLRYDAFYKNPMRLTPSIARNFLTFTILGTSDQQAEIHRLAIHRIWEHRKISQRKLSIGRKLLIDFQEEHDFRNQKGIAAFIGGDIAFFLAHDEPRPSHSSPDLMKGSDIDIIFIFEPGKITPETLERLDKFLMERKFILMRSPEHREELDFIIKPFQKFEEQFKSDDIPSKIASKIVYESVFLWGDEALFDRLKEAMSISGVLDVLEKDHISALSDREDAIKALLSEKGGMLTEEIKRLFYFSQERVEFE